MDPTCKVHVEFKGFSTTKAEMLEYSCCRAFVGYCFTLRGKRADSEARCTDFWVDVLEVIASLGCELLVMLSKIDSGGFFAYKGYK